MKLNRQQQKKNNEQMKSKQKMETRLSFFWICEFFFCVSLFLFVVAVVGRQFLDVCI